MFRSKVKIIRVAFCWILLGSLNLAAKIDIKQSEKDLEIRNGKLALNITKGGELILSYQLNGNLQRAVTLGVVRKEATTAIVHAFKLGIVSPAQAVIEVEYASADNTSVTVAYTIKDSFEYIEAESDFAQGKAGVSAVMKSEVMILPDFLAESIIFYPETAPSTSMRIPADNHLLVNLLDSGNAMLALLWESPKLKISETRKDSLFDSVTLSSDARTRFWIGILATRDIWHKAAEKINSDSFTALNWTPPFPAEWKLATFQDKGFHTDIPTCESWVLIQKGNRGIGSGIAIVNTSAWISWASGLGSFVYPCYLQDNKTFVKYPVLQLEQKTVFNTIPVLICALNGSNNTPSGVTMPKNALKILLSPEINKSIEAIVLKDKYQATCGITEKVEKIFYRNEATKEKNQIKRDFDNMNMFVLTIRERIEEYALWQRKMLEKQNRSIPQLHPAIEKELAQIALAYVKVKDNMKTPAYCKILTENIIALIDANLSDEEKEERCKQLGRQIRTIGGAQDGLLAKYRCIVKACRQYATIKLMTSSNPAEKELLENFRHETGLILNNRTGFMEGK